MVARCRTAVIVGVTARIVDVEADVSSGLPGLTIVGLADTAVSESRDRVRAAVEHSGLEWPRTRVTVALLPASLPKRGSALDAAIAVAILAASRQVPEEAAARACVLGELGLDGRIHAVPGAIAASLAIQGEGARLLVPVAAVGEAALVPGVDAGGVRDLAHLVGVLRGDAAPEQPGHSTPASAGDAPDLADVRGQSEARRALEVAAAGGHHLAMIGVPGVGKTLLAERLPGLMPLLDDSTALEVTAIRSAAGLDPRGLVRRVPFQAPHHSASMTAIVGGGQAGRLRIGAATLAHRGVLFLDEAPEFARSVLDALRQPLESGEVHIARADISGVLPARFCLVLAANPCPCGKGMGMDASCACSPGDRRRYAAKMSGPVMDRIDLRVALERPSLAHIGEQGEATAAVAARVAEARARSSARWSAEGVTWRVNGDVPGAALRNRHTPDEGGEQLLRTAFSRGALSMRGADRVLRVAWTLADLDGVARPGADHVANAMVLRGGGLAWAA
jgi:magnesium chelatase family protein